MKYTALGITMLACSALLCALPAIALADAPGEAPKKRAFNPGSDAVFDKRLPPVFPGEEIDDSGNRLKVWSTSGPVPVSQAPEPWRRERYIDDVDVVIDGRHEHDRHRGHGHRHDRDY